jgi:altronate hydrolase
VEFIRISPKDNVAVATAPVASGSAVSVDGISLTALCDIPAGHKIALTDIPGGGEVIKYGFPIGRASQAIKAGEHVHSHNLSTGLSGELEYEYRPKKCIASAPASGTFDGYLREDGNAGTRNEIWILPTVGCVNGIAQNIAKAANEKFSGLCGGVFAFTHPYGCSQLGDDLGYTQKVLAGLAYNPNAAGVLVLGLGCEANGIDFFKKALGGDRSGRIKFLNTQDSSDELADGLKTVGALAARASGEKRSPLPLSKLTIGFKCGGSDGFSGITANPLCGRVTDMLTACGGRVMLTEVPEMFGAEQILMERCRDRDVFDRTAAMINGFKEYYIKHGQPVYENPSPGNKAGGITTLEEKSLGCVQKGGAAQVNDVLEYGGRCRTGGLTLLTGPGNDLVSSTNLAAAGASLILFTTGRGTPFGAPVPTIKISTNSVLGRRKPGWIDYDAGAVLAGRSFEDAANELMELTRSVASGAQTKNELNGFREIAIFKDGVTL